MVVSHRDRSHANTQRVLGFLPEFVSLMLRTLLILSMLLCTTDELFVELQYNPSRKHICSGVSKCYLEYRLVLNRLIVLADIAECCLRRTKAISQGEFNAHIHPKHRSNAKVAKL